MKIATSKQKLECPKCHNVQPAAVKVRGSWQVLTSCGGCGAQLVDEEE
jgi:transcription elongation factor Elf1